MVMNAGPCHGLSTCLPSLGHYICVCPPAYSGTLCNNREYIAAGKQDQIVYKTANMDKLSI